MNTQSLQHALSQLLHDMQEQMAELNHTIGDVELRLNRSHSNKQNKEPVGSKSGGRRSAGWTDAARAQVAARMRDYWRKWREDRQGHHAEATASGPSHPKGAQVKDTPGRSTAGWTPQARQQAAERMRARWNQYRADVGDTPCD
jgi:hypothetical protein